MNVKSEGLTLYVEIDDDPLNPRKDCDNFGKMLCWHRRYNLGDKNPYKHSEDFHYDKELQKSIFAVLPVYLYDHSGLTVSSAPFSCPWDSGQVGIIYVTKEDAKREYGDLSEETKINVIERLESEIKEYDNYLTGNYYYFAVEDEEGEVVDTCGNFTGTSMTEILQSMKTVASLDYDFLFDKMIDKERHADMC